MSLHSDALQQALADHERESHGVTEVVAIPDDCMADVKQRYDAIAPKLPDDAVDSIAQMLWTRGIGSKQGGRIAAEDIVSWIKNQLRGGSRG